MADDWHVANTYMAYISNKPYIYPTDYNDVMDASTSLNTGWCIIPNLNFSHFMTPKQWTEFVIQNEAYTVSGTKCTIFNMIPMTTQLAIQNTSIFTAFNNTIYALGYIDKLYETGWENWNNITSPLNWSYNLLRKEGLAAVPNTQNNQRMVLPVYQWPLPHSRTTTATTWAFDNASGNIGFGVWPAGFLNTLLSKYQTVPTGVVWDPLNMPNELMELRPGKNAMTFSWEPHECDTGRWYNLDRLASLWPHVPEGPYGPQRPGSYKLTSQLDPDRLASRWQNVQLSSGSSNTNRGLINDYTICDYSDLPIVPCGWFWEEISHSIVQDTPATGTGTAQKTNPILKPNMFNPGTEYEKWKYPPTQWFTKMIPLFDTNNTLVEIWANVSIKIELFLKVKKRRSAIYAPTWGPIAWKNVYSAQNKDKNFIEAYIRYRTGGARRTWQNIGGPDGNDDSGTPSWMTTGHPRVDPYDQQQINASNQSSTGGIAGTSYTYTTAKPDEKLIVTFSTQTKPVAPKRKVQRQPSPELPVSDLTFYPQNLPDTQL
ncbi:capsid protein [Psittacine chaphamaparvovirus 2]|nr:capsid protein [Psittacine chaphamaparvovirus 2]